MKARIHCPARNVMQSGKARTRHWVLDFNPTAARFIEPLMGWTGTHDTSGQVSIRFAKKEEAIAFAEKHGIPYEATEPQSPQLAHRAYADNFAFGRIR